MPDLSLQIGGLHSLPFSSSYEGILNFGTWDNGAGESGEYQKSTLIKINTPGVTNINGVAVHEEASGVFIDGIADISKGFAFDINSSSTLPAGENQLASLGVVNFETFALEYRDINGNPSWDSLTSSIGGFYNTSGNNQQLFPGNPIIDGDYTVIMHSSPVRGAGELSDKWGMRITYQVAVGNLAAWVMEEIYPYEAYSGEWTLTSGGSDELAAAHLLVNGYGLTLDGNASFWIPTNS